MLLQWEDFSKNNARRILERYQDEVCSFNDDIQGTAAVTLAGLLAAVQVSGTKLIDQRVVIVGAGSAGTGIGDLVVRAMMDDGLSEQEALDRVWIFNSKGLVNSVQTGLEPAVTRFVKRAELLQTYGLECQQPNLLHEVVAHVHPTALIGVSGQAGSFSESIVREMTRHVYHPIIFPLSNPTSHSEAVPADLMVWTEGRALIATGSPFAPVIYAGKEHAITQCNNSLVFPGLGLAVLSGSCSRVVTEMFVAAGRALATLSPALHDPIRPLLPGLETSRTIAQVVATAIISVAQEAGVSETLSPEQVQKRIVERMWMPNYPEICPVSE
jgi:malate dehydrogenase (oxaloacetate-decarboxylating)